jgi:V/A-type H+-transporting ATPase subunit E
VGYPELLRVLGEEAAREARDALAAGARERERILAEARSAAASARDAMATRERAEAEAARRAAVEAAALARERTLLVERRRHLGELRAEVLRRLGAEGGPELDARLLPEVLAEVGGGSLEIEVDPDAETAVRSALLRLDPAVALRAVVRAAPSPRGGVRARCGVAGRRELDDTLPARLERAWTDLEAELAELLFSEDRA